MTVLEELEGTIQEAAERTGPKVIGLGQGWGRGSGFVIGANRMLTNAHNLRGDEVTVRFSTAAARERTRLWRPTGHGSRGDRSRDGRDRAARVAEEDNGAVPIGRAVLALANPGGRGLRVTPGFVSSTARSFRGPRGRRITGAIEHTAPLPRGSSGGPLIDSDGGCSGSTRFAPTAA